MNYLRLGLIGLVLLALGTGLGYYFAPDKIKIQEKIVEKEVTKKEEYKKKTKKYDKDGKVREETEETGTKETNTETKKSDKTIEKVKEQKHYAIKVGAAQSLTKNERPVPRVGAELRLPFFNSWLGGEFDIELERPKAGLYLRMEF